MNNWKNLMCGLMLVMIFGSTLDRLRFRQHQSPSDMRAWIEWRDTYIPAANGRNVA
jgi:hypothetical protein